MFEDGLRRVQGSLLVFCEVFRGTTAFCDGLQGCCLALLAADLRRGRSVLVALLPGIRGRAMEDSFAHAFSRAKLAPAPSLLPAPTWSVPAADCA